MLKPFSAQSLASLNNRSFYLVVLWSLLALLLLLFEASISRFLFEQSQLSESNLAYLNKLTASLTDELIILKEIKALLSTIETSQFGVSIIVNAQITVGKEISSLTELTDRGGTYLELAILASQIMVLLTHLSHFVLPMILLFILLALALMYFGKWQDYSNIEAESSKLLRVLTMWFVMLHFALPYSIHFAAAVSNHIENQKPHQLNGYAQHFHHELKGDKTHQDLSKKAKALIHKGESLLSNFKHKVSSMFRYVSQLLLRKLLLALVIPVLLFGFLFFTLRYILNSTLMVRDELTQKT